MKVITVFGTRPEIIRLSRVIALLDRFCEHVIVHTGQNYDPSLSDIFFRELAVRSPDIHLGIEAPGFGEQAGSILAGVGETIGREQPDRILVLGDTNSGLAAIVAARKGVPVFHLEAGNRCYDDRVPEEVNRRIIDHCSSILMPYTHHSKENLLREGIERERIFVVGNPIYEVLRTFAPQIEESEALKRLGVMPGQYFLVTLHRAENVDHPARLASLLSGLSRVADKYGKPMLFAVHPRTASKLKEFKLKPASGEIRLLAPLGFFDMVKLERNAMLVLSDSGTVQEECAILGVPNVTIRDVTERPETVECGSNILSGARPGDMMRATDLALSLPTEWSPPPEYTVSHVAPTVAKIVLGYTSIKGHHAGLTSSFLQSQASLDGLDANPHSLAVFRTGADPEAL